MERDGGIEPLIFGLEGRGTAIIPIPHSIIYGVVRDRTYYTALPIAKGLMLKQPMLYRKIYIAVGLLTPINMVPMAGVEPARQ